TVVLARYDFVRLGNDAEGVIAVLAAHVAGRIQELGRFGGLRCAADLAFRTEVPFDRHRVERDFRAVPRVCDDRDAVLHVGVVRAPRHGLELDGGDDAAALADAGEVVTYEPAPGDGAAFDGC